MPKRIEVRSVYLGVFLVLTEAYTVDSKDVFNTVGFGTCSIHAEEKELCLILGCPKDLPPVRADKKLIQRVVSNPVENVIRYSRKGGVELHNDPSLEPVTD